jgi:FKBP-type peptidyl-prolyl cis-trans isomerase
MKKLSTQQYIAVGAGLALVAFFLYGATIVGLFTGNNGPQAQAVTNVDNNTQNGVKITDVKMGTGEVAQSGDTLTVNYTGKLPDGKVFDSSIDRGQPFVFPLGAGQVIKGWDQGLVGMKVGGVRELVISPEFGYGPQAVGPIPANSTLIFDVTLLGVQHGTGNQ